MCAAVKESPKATGLEKSQMVSDGREQSSGVHHSEGAGTVPRRASPRLPNRLLFYPTPPTPRLAGQNSGVHRLVPQGPRYLGVHVSQAVPAEAVEQAAALELLHYESNELRVSRR